MTLIATNRTTGCSHMTAMLLLTFNSMQRPQHNQLSLDNQLVDRGLKMLDQVADETQSEIVLNFRKTCAGLHQRSAEMRCSQRDGERTRSGYVDGTPQVHSARDGDWEGFNVGRLNADSR